MIARGPCLLSTVGFGGLGAAISICLMRQTKKSMPNTTAWREGGGARLGSIGLDLSVEPDDRSSPLGGLHDPPSFMAESSTSFPAH